MAAAGGSGPRPALPAPVEPRPLAGVTQHLVRFGDLFKPLLSAAVLVFVRVELKSHLSVSFFDFILGGSPVNTEYPVVVLVHSHCNIMSGDESLLSRVCFLFLSLQHNHQFSFQECRGSVISRQSAVSLFAVTKLN